ncbi:tyrosine-type recombinase/integrase [Desulfatibacillum aliphaticivorans]|uniref:tyrosine-type recombinase/integrase n=1 Tax=Desulfatibacillum aliphaticivorans TaxID=218208 RepID=UPI000408249B|nr:site-specific integrase [Desulfatibacillum aliphaticivorans]
MIRKTPFIVERKSIPWWYYDFTVKGKRYRGYIGAKSEMNKREAQQRLDEIWARILTSAESPRRRQTSKSPGQVFKEYADYLEMHRPKTWESFRYLKHHFESFFRGKLTISPSDVKRYQKQKWDEGLSGPTINRHMFYARAAYNKAGVKPNPFDGFDKFDEFPRTRYLSKEELSALMSKATGVLREIVLTAILTGMRKGEILNLHKRHLDFGNQLITVPGSETKGKRPLTIPLPGELEMIFKQNLQQHESGFVFENKHTGKPLVDIKKAWKAALKDAEIKDFRFHDLRHTYATYSLLVSKDIRILQELLGHSSIRTTEKYAHIMTAGKRDASNAVSSFISKILENDADKPES